MEAYVLQFCVDYNISLEEMILDSDFNAKKVIAQDFFVDDYTFPHPQHLIGRSQELEGTLFSFYHEQMWGGRSVVPLQDIIDRMRDEGGFRPAKAAELLAYCQAVVDTNFLSDVRVMAVGQTKKIFYKNVVYPSVYYPYISIKSKDIDCSGNLNKHEFRFLGVK